MITNRVPSSSSDYSQVVNGYLYGIAFGAGMALLSFPFFDKSDFNNIVIPFQAALAGYVIGVAVGVYNSGIDEYTDASFLATFLGSIIGTALFIIPAPFVALIGFNYTKSKKQINSISYLFNNYSYVQVFNYSIKF
jgi:NAD/NADP transhydrogenase beta subunit